jgi:hypothetical protein
MYNNLIIFGAFLLFSGCGKDTLLESVSTPAYISNDSRHSHDRSYDYNSGRYNDRQYGRSNGANWRNSYQWIYIQYDREYLEALKTRAEADLVKAKSKAAKDTAIAGAINQITDEIRTEMNRLNQLLDRSIRQEKIIRNQLIFIDQMIISYKVTQDTIIAVKNMLSLSRDPQKPLSMLNILSQDVASFSATDLKSDGKIYIEKNENGELVFRKAHQGSRSFKGGSLLDYLEFLSLSRSIPNNEKSKEPIVKISKAIIEQGTARLETMATQREQLRTKTEKKFASLRESLTKLGELLD